MKSLIGGRNYCFDKVVNTTNEGSENTRIIRFSKVIEQYDSMLVFLGCFRTTIATDYDVVRWLKNFYLWISVYLIRLVVPGLTNRVVKSITVMA